MTTAERRWIAAIVSLAAQLQRAHKGGHRLGCIQVVSGGGSMLRCDCGYEAILTDIAMANDRLSKLGVQKVPRGKR